MNKSVQYLGIIILLAVGYILLSNDKFKSDDTNDFGQFSITLPEGWNRYELQGIDSKIGGITNGIDSLTYDYGWYSNDLKNEPKEKQLFARDTVNGKIAVITRPRLLNNGTIGMFIQNASSENHFYIGGTNITDEDLVLEIFKSVIFKDGDTLVNSKQIEFN